MLLIPVLFLRGGEALKPSGKSPLDIVNEWSRAGAELIHIVDLDTPPSGASPNTELLKKIKNDLKVNFQIEAHVRSMDTCEKYIGAGAERVVLDAIAYQKPAFLTELCKLFPKKIAAHIDVRRGKVSIKGWSVAPNKTALDYVAQFKNEGVSTIFYSDSEEEGVLKPADFENMRDFLRKALIKVIQTTDISVISEIEQLIMLEAYGLTGTLLSKSLHEGKIDLEGAITLSKDRSRGGDEPTYTET
jgi:phosphoribosylformimino-5-aminoimidazole carboxamide ribotide isomerase